MRDTLRRQDGKKDHRSKSVTERLEAARRSRYKIVSTRNLYLMWAIAESGSYAHLEPVIDGNKTYWTAVLCVHSKAGQLSFRLTADDMPVFGHLPQAATAHWDGHTAAENVSRIQQMITGHKPPLEVTPGGANRVQKLRQAGIGQHHALVVAQQALGKPLPKGAVVHHVNGDPSDNRPENLVICQDRNYHMLLHKRMRERQKTT